MELPINVLRLSALANSRAASLLIGLGGRPKCGLTESGNVVVVGVVYGTGLGAKPGLDVLSIGENEVSESLARKPVAPGEGVRVSASRSPS